MHSTFMASKMVPLIVMLIFFTLWASPAISMNSEGNALNAFKMRVSDPYNVLQSWDPTLLNPCSWLHVMCDNQSHLIRIDLGNANLTGRLGAELGRLHHLQYLQLFMNNFQGTIPKNLGNLKNLVSIDLSDNKFKGEIPKSFAKLKSLMFLRLNNNKLTGPIPRELDSLPNLEVFDVSKNDLCGTIPPSLSSFPRPSFYNNPRLKGPEKGPVPYNFGC
ncbi:uncharacterized protein LOC143854720 [Tasmannia lanceolata]|uniref:uncharacterized protein LOC143854720 n=1 Tax=Tasmannia lanceolata TaxID=3420 RepID=UPI004063440B